MKKSKIYINGKIIGTCDDPEDFVTSMREKRRSGEVSPEMNITHYHETDEIYLFTDPGRTRRPLIVVEDGVSKLTEEHIGKLETGDLSWDTLINEGIIEYMDAEEEENSMVALNPEEINDVPPIVEKWFDYQTIIKHLAAFPVIAQRDLDRAPLFNGLTQ